MDDEIFCVKKMCGQNKKTSVSVKKHECELIFEKEEHFKNKILKITKNCEFFDDDKEMVFVEAT